MLATENQKQILIVDRDLATVEPLRHQLMAAGFAVLAITDGPSAVVCVEERPPRLLIVDWDLPDLPAAQLIESVRRTRLEQPLRLIILSDRAGEHDVVLGLNMGADDYIARPFSVREAVARIQAVLRSRACDMASDALTFDRLTLNTSSNRVLARGTVLKIRGAEYRLLEFLMSHPGRTFNRTQLLAQVWAGDADIDERTVDVNVQRLRKILSKPGYEGCIQTVRGFGYRFVQTRSHF